RVPITPDDDQETLFSKLVPLAPAMFVEALAAVAAGAPGRPQATEGASYAPLRSPADRVLDWTQPAAQLRNRVRAWRPQGALATAEGGQWIVTRASLAGGMTNGPLAVPGQIVAREPAGLLVQTGDGLLRLDEAAPDTADA